MQVRLRIAVLAVERSLSVSEIARREGVSRDFVHELRRRFDGTAASVEPRSRRPHRSPSRISDELVAEIVRLRKDLELDNGPATIRFHMLRDPRWAQVPAETTIWRVLCAGGFVTPAPKKRPKAACRRFEFPNPNDCWQFDATEWHLDDGTMVQIISALDDCSRLLTGCRAVPHATSDAAWDTFAAAAARWALPVLALSDNGLAFSGKLRGFEVNFERNLRALGVRPITARPFHPQTCGKIERFHQTLKAWLRRHAPRCGTITELQAALDRFAAYYNHRRPHRALRGVTPYERFTATPTNAPTGTPLPAPIQLLTTTVDDRGVARAGRYAIHVGSEHRHATLTVALSDTRAVITQGATLIRALDLDTSRYYQPSGRPRGGRTTNT